MSRRILYLNINHWIQSQEIWLTFSCVKFKHQYTKWMSPSILMGKNFAKNNLRISYVHAWLSPTWRDLNVQRTLPYYILEIYVKAVWFILECKHNVQHAEFDNLYGHLINSKMKTLLIHWSKMYMKIKIYCKRTF